MNSQESIDLRLLFLLIDSNRYRDSYNWNKLRAAACSRMADKCRSTCLVFNLEHKFMFALDNRFYEIPLRCINATTNEYQTANTANILRLLQKPRSF